MSVHEIPEGYAALIPVDDVPLTTRTKNGIKLNGMATVGDLATLSREQWMRTPNIGRVSVDEIAGVLRHYGLDFRDDKEAQLDRMRLFQRQVWDYVRKLQALLRKHGITDLPHFGK